MTKAEQIVQALNEAPQIGERVNVEVPYKKKISEVVGKGKNKDVITSFIDDTFRTSGKVVKIATEDVGLVYYVDFNSQRVPSEVYEGRQYYGDNHVSGRGILAEYVKKEPHYCGANPFRKTNVKVEFHHQPIESLLSIADYHDDKDNVITGPNYNVVKGSSSDEIKYAGKTYGGVNFDPYVFDKDGKKVYYQRGLIWTLHQKQLLIDSVYNGIEIGKFIFKYNSWKHILKSITEIGHGYDYDCVDGKQRHNAIIDFCLNKFQDSYGNYYADLSADAQRKFLNYSNMAIGRLDENATNANVIETFLTLNFTGTPMSEEHINYVKNIKI